MRSNKPFLLNLLDKLKFGGYFCINVQNLPFYDRLANPAWEVASGNDLWLVIGQDLNTRGELYMPGGEGGEGFTCYACMKVWGGGDESECGNVKQTADTGEEIT